MTKVCERMKGVEEGGDGYALVSSFPERALCFPVLFCPFAGAQYPGGLRVAIGRVLLRLLLLLLRRLRWDAHRMGDGMDQCRRRHHPIGIFTRRRRTRMVVVTLWVDAARGWGETGVDVRRYRMYGLRWGLRVLVACVLGLSLAVGCAWGLLLELAGRDRGRVLLVVCSGCRRLALTAGTNGRGGRDVGAELHECGHAV